MKEENTSLASQLRAFKTQLSLWPSAFKLVWAAAPGWTTAWGALVLCQGLLPVASVYLLKLLVDSFLRVNASRGDWVHVRETIVYASLVGLVMLGMDLAHSASEWVRAVQAEIVQDHIKGLVHQKSSEVDLAFYESPDYHDGLERARNESINRPLALLDNCGTLIQHTVTLISMAVVLIPYGAWLPVILLMSTLPAFLLVVRFERTYHRWWKAMTPDRRWVAYYDLMLTDSRAAPEVKLFGLGGHFQDLYKNLRGRLRRERLRQMGKQALAKLVASALALLVVGAVMSWMVWRVIKGTATLGDLALFYQAFNRGQGLMRSLLTSASQIITNSLYLSHLFTFLELKSTISAPPVPVATPRQVTQGIEFSNITFAYPGSSRTSLKNFNLQIPAGKVVAIVGANGAGKTTLLKLLCRFYDPTSGAVKIDGRSIKDFSPEEYWKMITVLFQFPTYYHATVKDSITLGQIEQSHPPDEIKSAAESAGLSRTIEKLPQGYDTQLGKWFADGVELSGGEWQRIAMARAYLRKSPIILLDEPTSHMDSWAEAEWFGNFRELAQGRTSIIITHRFTIAMRADIIHVMDEGEIVESGSHHDLLSRDGLYAQSWINQMQASEQESSNEEDSVTLVSAGAGARSPTGQAFDENGHKLEIGV